MWHLLCHVPTITYICVTVSTFLYSPHTVNQPSRLVVRGVHQLPLTCRSSGSPCMRQGRPHPTHMCGYVFVCPRMRRRPPPKSPIKGRVLPSLVSQSLALKSSTSKCVTSDASLVSSCTDNTPMTGLCWYCSTIGQDPARVFCVAVHHVYVETTLVPYSYPQVLQHIYFLDYDAWKCLKLGCKVTEFYDHTCHHDLLLQSC